MRKFSPRSSLHLYAISLFFWGAGHVFADQTQEIEELKAAVRAMQQTITQLQGQVATLQEKQAQPTQPARTPESTPALKTPESASLAALKEAVLPASPTGTTQPASRMTQEQWSQTNQGLATLVRPRVFDDVPAGPQPRKVMENEHWAGFHELSDSGWWIHVGGLLMADVSFSNYEGDDSFANSLNIRQSRLHVDLRRNSDLGPVRLYYEMGANSNTRHLYAQVGGLTFGQTWSAFFDPSTAPDSLNLNFSTGNRIAPQIRYTFPLESAHLQLAVAVESTRGEGVYTQNPYSSGYLGSRLPSLVVQARWEDTWGHLQLAGVFRDLHYSEIDNVSDRNYRNEDTFGYGLSLTTALHLSRQDHLVAGAAFGNGISPYFSNSNEIYNDYRDNYSRRNPSGSHANGKLDLFQSWRTFVGYQHRWSDKVRTQISWIHFSDEPDTGGFNYSNTALDTAQANLIWMLNDQLSAGIEFQYDFRSFENDIDHDQHSLMFSLMYRFF